jgi:hypothetical protein
MYHLKVSIRLKLIFVLFADPCSLIKTKKERLSKTSYYDNQLKLKEFYVKICKNFPCYGCILFQIKEIVVNLPTPNKLPTPSQFSYSTIKKVNIFTVETRCRKFFISVKNLKVKRILAIKPNKMFVLDYKTKTLIRSQRMTDLKSWYSGDSSYLSTNHGLLKSATGTDHSPTKLSVVGNQAQSNQITANSNDLLLKKQLDLNTGVTVTRVYVHLLFVRYGVPVC